MDHQAMAASQAAAAQRQFMQDLLARIDTLAAEVNALTKKVNALQPAKTAKE